MLGGWVLHVFAVKVLFFVRLKLLVVFVARAGLNARKARLALSRAVLMVVALFKAYFLQVLIKLALSPTTRGVVTYRLLLNLIVEDLLRQINGALHLVEIVDLWVVLITTYHHALLSVLNQVRVVAFYLEHFS